MRRERVVFWLGELSPHQSSYIGSLATLLPGIAIIGVFEGPLKRERRTLGWQEPELGHVEIHNSPDTRLIEDLVLKNPEGSVHIFGGLRLPMVRRALRICASTEALIGVLSECRRWSGWLGKMRLLHSVLVEKRYRQRIDFVLAIGHLGVRWFQLCGYPVEIVFPWGYFVENDTCSGVQPVQHRKYNTHANLAFVGQCILRKGIDTLLRALAVLPRDAWSLQVIGEGMQRRCLERLARKLGIAPYVSFVGVKMNSEVRCMLEQSDLLVLPSRHDGWGAVVNEALMSGVPVVCSDQCGAADLIRGSDRGETFHAGDWRDLARVLAKWIGTGRLVPERRSEIRAWSKCIEGEAAARYLGSIIEHVEAGDGRPIAPWLQGQSGAGPTMRVIENPEANRMLHS
jgi:glycosyltransferase involved in cell wall biosynthesis